MIKLSNIKISRKNFELNIEKFFIEDGKSILLLGNSGCGKTTLLKLLSGFVEKYEGDIHFENQGATTSIMLQNPIDQMITPTVETELKFSLVNRKIDDEIIEKKIEDIAIYFDIINLLKNNLRELSFGELQKVMLAATFLTNANYYFLDEPTSHLDHKSTKILYNYIQKIVNKGKTVIIASQNFDEYLYSDKTLIMNDGKIVDYLDSSKINENRDRIGKYGLKSSNDEIVRILHAKTPRRKEEGIRK